MTGMTFDDAGLKGGDVVVVLSDPRAICYYEGQILRLRDTKRGIRAPDMTNGSEFEWEKHDEVQ